MGIISCSQTQIRDCFNDALQFRNENRDVSRDTAYFEWRYLDRPCEVPAYVVWIREGGTVLGAATVAPHDFRVAGRNVRLGLVGDISISLSARGKGVGSQLMANVRAELPPGVDDVLVLPNDQVSGPLLRAGWQNIGVIERRVCMLGLQNYSLAPGAMIHSAMAGISSLLYRTSSKVGAEYSIHKAESSLSTIDKLWVAVEQRSTNLSRRDTAYLRWRYNMHPTEVYDIDEIRRGEKVCGYVVSHLIDNSRWIDDFLVSDDVHALPLVYQIVRSARLAGDCNALHVRLIRGMPGYCRSSSSACPTTRTPPAPAAYDHDGIVQHGDPQAIKDAVPGPGGDGRRLPLRVHRPRPLRRSIATASTGGQRRDARRCSRSTAVAYARGRRRHGRALAT